MLAKERVNENPDRIGHDVVVDIVYHSSNAQSIDFSDVLQSAMAYSAPPQSVDKSNKRPWNTHQSRLQYSHIAV
jgi:hypothetical protein